MPCQLVVQRELVEAEEVQEGAKGLKDKVQGALNQTDLDEKIVEGAKGLKGKVQEALDKTDLDEKRFLDQLDNWMESLGLEKLERGNRGLLVVLHTHCYHASKL